MSQRIILFILILTILLMTWYANVLYLNSQVFIIVNRGILAPNCTWWNISDLLVPDGSGVHLYYQLKNLYGKMIPLNMLGERIYLVTDINYITQILQASPFIFGVGKFKFRMFKLFMEHNVGVSQGREWITRRKITDVVLAEGHLHPYAQIYHDFIRQLFTEELPLNFNGFATCSRKLAMKIVFGVDDPSDTVFKIFSEANSTFAVLHPNYVINPEIKNAYMSYLLKQIANPNPYSLVELAKSYTTDVDELVNHIPHWLFPIAGLIPVTCSRALLLLCNHPKKFEKLINELRSSDDLSNAKNVYEIKYLRYCILETLRLNNPVVTTFRTLLSDYCFDQNRTHCYTKGTQFLILNNPVLRGFDHPNEFIPERWARQNLEKSDQAIMFNQGPQRCPGKELAIFLAGSTIVNFCTYAGILQYGQHILKCQRIDTSDVPQMMNPCKISFRLDMGHDKKN